MKKLIILLTLLGMVLAQENTKKFERSNLYRKAKFFYIETGNLDRDPQMEILMLSTDYRTVSNSDLFLYSVDGITGKVEWRSDEFSWIRNYKSAEGKRIYEVHLEDVDLDNKNEIIILGQAKLDRVQKIHVYDAD